MTEELVNKEEVEKIKEPAYVLVIKLPEPADYEALVLDNKDYKVGETCRIVGNQLQFVHGGGPIPHDIIQKLWLRFNIKVFYTTLDELLKYDADNTYIPLSIYADEGVDTNGKEGA